MQHLEIIDYFGVLAVWCSFFSIIFIISNTCIRICCIHKEDEHVSPSLETHLQERHYRSHVLNTRCAACQAIELEKHDPISHVQNCSTWKPKIASQQNFEDYFLPDPHRSSSNS